MAYSGSTAASSVANPPIPVLAPLARTGSSLGFNPRGAQLWFYASSDGSTVVSAANYFTDAWYLGMRPGDVVIGSQMSSLGSTSGYSYRLWCSGVTTAGASFSTGQMSTG